MTTDPTTDPPRGVSRRQSLCVVGGVTVSTLIAGCIENEAGSHVDSHDGDYLDEDKEPDYEGWVDDVDAYDGTIDARGEDEVVVAVGSYGGLAFAPPAILIEPGTTVVWEWTGEGGRHDVVHVDGDFESELVSEEGHIFEHAFDDPGMYRYICVPHEGSGMKGVIAVEE